MEFETLLHTYLRVPDCTRVTVSGLCGLPFVDKVDGMKRGVEDRDLVPIKEHIDRLLRFTF
jgi:D-hexose-6-phosphate mutarotase